MPEKTEGRLHPKLLGASDREPTVFVVDHLNCEWVETVTKADGTTETRRRIYRRNRRGIKISVKAVILAILVSTAIWRPDLLGSVKEIVKVWFRSG